MKIPKLTKLEQTVLRLTMLRWDFTAIAGQLNRTVSSIECAYARAISKRRLAARLRIEAVDTLLRQP